MIVNNLTISHNTANYHPLVIENYKNFVAQYYMIINNYDFRFPLLSNRGITGNRVFPCSEGSPIKYP